MRKSRKTEKKYFLIAMLVLLAVAALPFFNKDRGDLCPLSYTYSDGYCCLDEDENGLCDKHQAIEKPNEEPKEPGLEMPVTIAPSEKRTYQIIMRDIKFYPDKLNITAGDAVEWANMEDVLSHAVYETNQLFRSSRLAPGEKFTYTFKEPGEYRIYTQIYTKAMNMEVTVKEKTLPGMTADLVREIREQPTLSGIITALFIIFVILINFWIFSENKKR